MILEFLNNEDVKELYVYSKSSSQLIASKSCASDINYEKGVYFVKTKNTTKLTADLMSEHILIDFFMV